MARFANLPPADKVGGGAASRYPMDWPVIARDRIVAVGSCCTGSPRRPACRAPQGQRHPEDATVVTRLAVVHRNGLAADVRPANLMVLCQFCHADFWEVKDDPAYWPFMPWSMDEVTRRICAMQGTEEIVWFRRGLVEQRMRLTAFGSDMLTYHEHDLLRKSQKKTTGRPRKH